MDLTVVAQMIARDVKPDLFHLQEQYYRLMADDYRRSYAGTEFPLDRFSEAVYQRRLSNEETTLPQEEFPNEVRCMAEFKMVIPRPAIGPDGQPTTRWYFRHDKIEDFFVVRAFLVDERRQVEHLGDPRFRDVYLLLALLLPEDAAIGLRERLIQYAADAKDHTVSDQFVQLLRLRPLAA